MHDLFHLHGHCNQIILSDSTDPKGSMAVETGTLADRVYRTLREQILQGNFKPGQKLNLDQLARELNVSNSPLREAMARLERLGLVEIIPYAGPKIKRLSATELHDTYEVRIALEELAVRLIARRNEPERFNDMAAALEAQERACQGDDPRAVIDADRAFHDALVEASGNSLLLEMLPNLSDRTRNRVESTPIGRDQ